MRLSQGCLKFHNSRVLFNGNAPSPVYGDDGDDGRDGGNARDGDNGGDSGAGVFDNAVADRDYHTGVVDNNAAGHTHTPVVIPREHGKRLWDEHRPAQAHDKQR